MPSLEFFLGYWFEHILFGRKGLGVAYNATMPSPEVFTKEPNHTHIHTHTLSRIGCFIIANVLITRQYDSLVLTTGTDDPSLASTRVIIKVSGYQYQWLAGI